MALEIGTILLEAAISLAKNAWDADDNPSLQEQKLTEIAETVTEIQSQLTNIESILTRDDPPPEVARFRRARSIAAGEFCGEWDETLLDFATELLSLVMHDCIGGVKVVVEAVVHDRNTSRAVSTRSFQVVILAKKRIRENAIRLRGFFEELLRFTDGKRIPERQKPCMTVRIARGSSDDYQQFDRLKNRLTIRLLMLSTMAMGWGVNALGSVDGKYVYNRKMDAEICKHVDVHEVPCTFVHNVALSARPFVHDIGDVLRDALERNVAGVKVIIMSQGTWMPDADPKSVVALTGRIRMFCNRERIKCLELLCGRFDDWDWAMMRTVLLRAASASMVVFRFEDLEALGEIIGESKEITDRFPGLTTDRERFVFVYTRPTEAFQDLRNSIQEIAVERRLHAPYDSDVLFEAAIDTCVEQEISERARRKRSIINHEIRGATAELLKLMIHVFNGEISDKQAMEESMECMRFALRLKSKVNTRVQIRKDIGMVTISRGDTTGYMHGNANARGLLRASEYTDYRNITERPFTVDAVFKLADVAPQIFAKSTIFKKWPVVTEMASVVKEGKAFMAVADEKKTYLTQGDEEYVTAVKVTILGGYMRDFCHAKILRCCMDAIRIDLEQIDSQHMATRTLLRLVPELARATRTPPTV